MTVKITPEQFAQLKAAALEKARDLEQHSFSAWCQRCQRQTLHYLTMQLGSQQIYRCFGCGGHDAFYCEPLP